MFLLPKDFQDDHVVIDSDLADIERYKGKDDLLLIRERGIPFLIRIEDFYNDQSRWGDVNFLLWNNGNFSPYFGLQQEVNGVIDYQDKLKSDYKKIIKEYVVDFNQSISITHNQNDTLTSVGQDEERIGVVILKNITPDQIVVSSNGTDLMFFDKVSDHVVNLKNWNNSESYRISTLEFDLGLEPIVIRKLDRFSLSEVEKIQNLIEKASDNYQKRAKYVPNIETDLKCSVSVNGFKSENNTYECLGFSSLQDQINFTENFCTAGQIEEFKSKIPNNDQVLLLLRKLQNGLSLNGYDQNIIEQCNKLMITSELEILKLLINNVAQKGEWEKVKDLLNTTANRNNVDVENKNKWSSNWTLLHYAVYNGNFKLLENTYQLLLSKVIDINAQDEYGWTPLYYAIYYNEPDMVKFFTDRGANIDIKDNNGKTPLEIANEYSKPKIVNILMSKVIENGQSSVVKNFLKKTTKEVRVEDKDELRMDWGLLHYAAYNGRVDVLRDLFDLLLEKSGNNINVQENKYGWTPLHYAVYYGRSEMVKFLIDKGANTEARTQYDDTPLHIAARYCGLDMVKLLMDKGCNAIAMNNHKQMPSEVVGDQKVKQFLIKNELLPMHYAAKEGNVNLLEVMLNRGNNINLKDKHGWTPLHYAAENNRLYVMKLLINHNAIDIEARTKDGKTPLHIAAKQGCIASMNLLLSKKADIMAKTNGSDWNWTPLHYATYYNKPDAVKYLVDKGANVNARDKYGNTPVYYAAGGRRAYDRKERSISDSNYTDQSQEDRLEVLELLISQVSQDDIEAKNSDGHTLFHIAAQEGNLRSIRLLIDKIESVSFEESLYEKSDKLVKAVGQRERLKILINEKDKLGYTPLQYAAKNGNWGVVNLFLDKVAERNPDDVADKDQFSASWTTVHYAVYSGDVNLLKDVFEFIKDKGTIINTKDSSGWTPLHYAVYYNDLDVVKVLVNKGADINAKDKDSKTPSDLVTQENYKSIAEFLKQTQLGLNKQLLVAVRGNDFNKVKDLVSKGASVDTKDSDGWTLLHHTARRGYLEVAEFLIEKGAGINAEDKYGKKPIQRAAEDNNKNIITLLLSKGVNINDTDRNGRTSLYWASWSGHLDVVKYLIDEGADINARDKKDGKTPLNIARDKGHGSIVKYLEEKLNQGRERPGQRRRRHHHGDHDRHHNHLSSKFLAVDQPKIAASSGARPSSWINDLFDWVKGSVGGLLNSKPTLSKETSNTPNPISQVDAQMDVNGTIMLLDVIIRKFTGKQYIPAVDQSIPLLEARGYALNITNRFEKVLNKTAIKSGISVTNLNFDPVVVQSAIIGKIINGRSSEIAKTLYSFAKEACPEFKQTDKFLDHLRSNLKEEKGTVMLQQKVEKPYKDLSQEVSRKVELSKKPDTFLNGTSVVQGISRGIN